MTVPERLDGTRRVITLVCTNCGQPWHDGHETTCETVDPALSGNDDAPDLPDQSMQWGVRWDNGVVSVERDQEAASLAVNAWTARGVQTALVCRVCGPWQ